MGWEAQVSTPCSAYLRKSRPRMKSAMTEYSLRTKQTLQSGVGIPQARRFVKCARKEKKSSELIFIFN